MNFSSFLPSSRLMVAPLALVAGLLCTSAQAQTITKDVINTQGIRTSLIQPEGLCGAQSFEIEMERKGETWVLRESKFVNACEGLGAGLAAMIKGMEIEPVIQRLESIPACINSGATSSCPAQFAKALVKLKAATPKSI